MRKIRFYNSGATRDTDWYEFTLAVPTAVNVRFEADFDYQIGFIDGSAGCPVGGYHSVMVDNAGTVGYLTANLAAGTWYLWVGPSWWGPFSCGSDYNFSIYSNDIEIVSVTSDSPTIQHSVILTTMQIMVSPTPLQLK